MATFPNGQIPTYAMEQLSVGGYLLPAAAANFELWRAHAARDGLNLTITSAADAFRTYAIQERIFRERYTTFPLLGRPRKVWQNRTWYLKPGNATAAVPGTSNHGKGLAVDIRNAGGFNGSFYRWMTETGPKYGFSNTEGRSINEPWHWVSDNIARGAIGTIVDVIPDAATSTKIKELAEMSMPVRVRKHDGGIALVDTTRGEFRALDPTANALLARLGVIIPEGMDSLSDLEWGQVRQLVRDLAKPFINA